MSDIRPGDPPRAWRIAKMGWHTSLWSLQHMRLLMGSAVAALLLEKLVLGTLANVGLSLTMTALMMIGVETAITAWVAIAIHRLVLLDERQDHWIGQIPMQFTRFFGWLLLVKTDRVVLVLSWVFGGTGSPRLWPNLLATSYVIETIFLTRCLTLFPAVAINASSSSLRDAWRASKGHFWLLFGTVFCVALVPTVIWFGVFVLIIFGGTWSGLGWLVVLGYFGWWGTPLGAILLAMTIVAMAAAASILYRDVAYRPAR